MEKSDGAGQEGGKDEDGGVVFFGYQEGEERQEYEGEGVSETTAAAAVPSAAAEEPTAVSDTVGAVEPAEMAVPLRVEGGAGETGMEGGHGGVNSGADPGSTEREGIEGENGFPAEGEEEDNDQVFEKAVQDELDSRLRPDHRFFAVRALVEGGKAARKLNRRLKTQVCNDDGFLLKGDESYYRNSNESSIERRVNVSASFQYNGTCHTCLSGQHDAWQGRQGGECIKILRVENGALRDHRRSGEAVTQGGEGGRYPARLLRSDPL